MKCLDDEEELSKHYIEFHRVNPFNHFSQKLFKSGSEIFKPRKCCQCQDFLPTTKVKAVHDFLKHYDESKFNQFEEKPINIVKRGNVTSYEISA